MMMGGLVVVGMGVEVGVMVREVVMGEVVVEVDMGEAVVVGLEGGVVDMEVGDGRLAGVLRR